MDREQYIKNLKDALKESFAQQQANDILADYSEFFDAGIAEGKSESELCAEFGSPEKVAMELMNETIGAKKVRFQKQCVKITAIVFNIAILAYSIFYLFQNGHPNNVILTFLLAILPQLIISIEISNRHADFSSTKTNKYHWMKKAVLICYPLICIESTNFFVMGNYYLIMFSFLLFTKTLPCVFEAFAQNLIIAVLFALFLYLHRKLKAKGVKCYERANEKRDS
jgi:hypothetical protein